MIKIMDNGGYQTFYQTPYKHHHHHSYDDHDGHHGHRPRSYCGIPAARGKSKGVRRSVGPAAVATLLVPAHCIVATLPTSTSLGWN